VLVCKGRRGTECSGHDDRGTGQTDKVPDGCTDYGSEVIGTQRGVCAVGTHGSGDNLVKHKVDWEYNGQVYRIVLEQGGLI
jgi:hypothetical protein